MTHTLMPSELLQQVARRFKLLGEPTRLELLNLLNTVGESTVQALVESTGFSQPNVSKHLLLMAKEGLLNRRQSGLQVYYSISDPSLAGLCLLVCGQIREEAERQEVTRSVLQ